MQSGERAETTRLGGRKRHCKHKIAGSGELAPFTNMNATQMQSQGPSVSRADLCSRFEKEESCHSEFSLDCLRLERDRHQRASECSQVLSPEQPFSQDNHNHYYHQIMARSWPHATNVFKKKKKKSPSGTGPCLKTKLQKFLGISQCAAGEREAVGQTGLVAPL